MSLSHPHILVADNNDSFVYNLIQILREAEGCTFDIQRTEEINLTTLSQYNGVLLSPGPGMPSDQPNMMSIIDRCAKTHSILGVCLGHQAIGEYFGGKLEHLTTPLHGHPSSLRIIQRDCLLEGIEDGSIIGRYHSWVVSLPLPYALIPLAYTEEEDGIQRLMAMRHRSLPIWGVQFHPESMITQQGARYILNWLETIRLTPEHI